MQMAELIAFLLQEAHFQVTKLAFNITYTKRNIIYFKKCFALLSHIYCD